MENEGKFQEFSRQKWKGNYFFSILQLTFSNKIERKNNENKKLKAHRT